MTLDRFLTLVGIIVSLFLGLYTFAPEGWPKIPGWLILLGLFIGLVTLGIGLGLWLAKWKSAKADFELVFDPTDPHFHHVGDDRIRFSVALRNLSDRTITLPSVQTPDTEFANQIFTEANPHGWTRQVGAMRIYVGGDIDPQPKNSYPSLTGLLEASVIPS